MDYLSQVIKSQRARKSLSVINILGLPWWSCAVAFVLLMCIAFGTVARQVWRIIRLKPMYILRSE